MIWSNSNSWFIVQVHAYVQVEYTLKVFKINTNGLNTIALYETSAYYTQSRAIPDLLRMLLDKEDNWGECQGNLL